jgi:GT2 family glycosyltransferase
MSDIAAGTEPRVSVVIVNWRAPDDTLAAIECLRLQTCQPHRTYIVDNGSADGSLQKLETAGAGFVDTAVLANSENLGFGGGCNRGLKEALTDGCAFIWLLNNDAIPAPDCLGAWLPCPPLLVAGYCFPRLRNKAVLSLPSGIHRRTA